MLAAGAATNDFDELLESVPPSDSAASPGAVTVPAAPGGELAFGPFDGADRFNRQLANWNPGLQSADLDIIPSKPLADARARELLRNDAYIQGGANLHKDNIVGSQFLLNAKPATRVLWGNLDDTWETEFQEEVEELFDLCAESPDHLFDAAGINTFTGLVRLAVGIHVMAGEVLGTVEWVKDGRPFNTAIQMVDTDRLQNPPTVLYNNQVRGGIKRDVNGKPISYFIRTRHPNDYLPFWTFQSSLDMFTEVPRALKWGRLQVIHLFEQTRPDQTRGIAEMTAALKEMHITHRFRDVTLQNAVTQALYAAVITSDLPTEAIMQKMGGSTDAQAFQKAIGDYMVGHFSTVEQFAGGSKNLKADGVMTPHLPPGSKLDILTPGKGGPLGMEFEASLLRYIAATLGVSYEQLSRDYTNTNYSSARAAMTETWKFMQARKKVIADRFATIIYRLWLEEIINADMLKSFPKAKAAMLYTNGRLNMKFEALARCDWIGASRGQIDELKETQAAVLRINNGLSTAEDELARLGKDFRKVFRQLKREQMLQDALGILQQPTDTTNQMNAASGTAKDKTNPKSNGSAMAPSPGTVANMFMDSEFPDEPETERERNDK